MTLPRRSPAGQLSRQTAEDRYLGPGWSTRLETIEDLLTARDHLITAYRDGRIAPNDTDAISTRVEWIDARIGQLSRDSRLHRVTSQGRIRTTGAVVVGLVVALGVLLLVDAPYELVVMTMVAICGTIVATIWAWVTAPEPTAHDDDPELAER